MTGHITGRIFHWENLMWHSTASRNAGWHHVGKSQRQGHWEWWPMACGKLWHHPPQKRPFLWGSVPLAYPSPNRKWHLDQFSRFHRARGHYRHTDRQSICSNCPHLANTAMQPNNCSFFVLINNITLNPRMQRRQIWIKAKVLTAATAQ